MIGWIVFACVIWLFVLNIAHFRVWSEVGRQLSSLKKEVEKLKGDVKAEPTVKINKWVGLGADSSFVSTLTYYGDPYVNVKVKDIIKALCEELDVHITYEPGHTVQDRVVATKATPAKKTPTTKKGKK